MNVEQLKQRMAHLKEMLEEMKQERIEASAVYPESSWFIKDIDEDILLCSLSINDLRIAIHTKESK